MYGLVKLGDQYLCTAVALVFVLAASDPIAAFVAWALLAITYSSNPLRHYTTAYQVLLGCFRAVGREGIVVGIRGTSIGVRRQFNLNTGKLLHQCSQTIEVSRSIIADVILVKIVVNIPHVE